MAVSFATGVAVLHAAMGLDFKFSELSVATVAFSLWLWFIFAIAVHGLSRLFGGTAKFLDNLGVCLRVMPAVFLIAALVAMTRTLGGRLLSSTLPMAYAHLVFLVTLLILMACYLPIGLRRAHKLSIAVAVGMTAAGPVSAAVLTGLALAAVPAGVSDVISTLLRPAPGIVRRVDDGGAPGDAKPYPPQPRFLNHLRKHRRHCEMGPRTKQRWSSRPITFRL